MRVQEKKEEEFACIGLLMRANTIFFVFILLERVGMLFNSQPHHKAFA